MRKPLYLLLACLPLAYQQGQQEQRPDPDGVDETAVDVFGRPETDDENNGSLFERMQGAWQLVHIEDPLLSTDGRSHRGFLLVSGNFLAIEVHIAWDAPDGEPIEDAHQSGIHEFQVDPFGRLVTRALIGSFLDEQDELDWEIPGTPRAFRVTTEGKFLSLRREDGSRLDFARRKAFTSRARDVFGRPGETTEKTDIYGRPVSSQGREGGAEADDDDDGER